MNQRTRIKICGLTREPDLDAAIEAGADAVGFVCYAKSPRYIAIERVAELAKRLPPFVTPVGLFVNAPPSDIQAAINAIPQLVIQFHGDESAPDCDAVARPYMRAARMAAGFDLIDFVNQYPNAQAILLDAHVEGYGGGGKVFDWSLIPRNVPRPVVLSGGLHAGNVIEGILRVRPWAVDVSSGVEAAKGIKDAAAIRRFCKAVQEADARIAIEANT
ncbi:MAG: phosphoribosylanthranilate isomerase [Burkholderiales bacterium]|jgi:phosphoribosylanthranilate isomerase|nr:phosphoribosylanthranilate isomerase [Burkholderiales bacterium]